MERILKVFFGERFFDLAEVRTGDLIYAWAKSHPANQDHRRPEYGWEFGREFRPFSVETNRSLLDAAKEDPESEAWFRLVSIYDPLIAGWLSRSGVDESEIPDISQEVLVAVVQQIKNFDHNGRSGAFRNWLKRITYYRCQRFWDQKKSKDKEKEVRSLNGLEDPRSELSLQWDLEHDQYVLSRILHLIKSEFETKVFEAFERTTVKGELPAKVAADLGVTTGQIYKYRYRIMKRLKEEAAGLIDEGLVENLLS